MTDQPARGHQTRQGEPKAMDERPATELQTRRQDAMPLSFERLAQAPRYRRWILDQVWPALGDRLLEVGAGVGNFTGELLERSRLVALEPREDYLAILRRRFPGQERLRTVARRLEDVELPRLLAEERLDSAVLLNVLEHIEDDRRALINLRACLLPGASVAIQVPAHQWLMGASDRALGHYRRYTPTGLTRRLESAGLVVERVWQFNTLGVLGWFVSGRLRRERMFSSRQLAVYEALVPLLRRLEPRRGVPLGLSVMALARTPG